MQQREINYLTMSGSVMQLLSDNPEKWQSYANIVTTVNQLQTLIEDTRKAALVQDKSTTEGFTNQKSNYWAT